MSIRSYETARFPRAEGEAGRRRISDCRMRPSRRSHLRHGGCGEPNHLLACTRAVASAASNKDVECIEPAYGERTIPIRSGNPRLAVSRVELGVVYCCQDESFEPANTAITYCSVCCIIGHGVPASGCCHNQPFLSGQTPVGAFCDDTKPLARSPVPAAKEMPARKYTACPGTGKSSSLDRLSIAVASPAIAETLCNAEAKLNVGKA